MFDFAAFKRAYEAKDAAAWAACYAEDAEWIEYRHQNPPRRPHRLKGRAAIATFLRQVEAWPIGLKIEDEILAGDRIAFRSWVDLGDGRRIIEHVMLYIEKSLIIRQIEVEACD
ncbi:MAG TPA: nuclear transport factor 2 family protein [Bauldia sp.]|nr:nuclear transport factor 2 family protein [Bauldia sp.]